MLLIYFLNILKQKKAVEIIAENQKYTFGSAATCRQNWRRLRIVFENLSTNSHTVFFARGNHAANHTAGQSIVLYSGVTCTVYEVHPRLYISSFRCYRKIRFLMCVRHAHL